MHSSLLRLVCRQCIPDALLCAEAVRDVVGGRAGAIQDTLRDLRGQALEELRQEASRVGADAVVGVDLDYSEFSGGGRSMLFIVANGTAVRLK